MRYKGGMVIESSGDSQAILVARVHPEWNGVVTAFGTSMSPFLSPGSELRLERADSADIRVGDIVTFRSGSGVLVTHRVIRIFSQKNEISFLTKGDGRLDHDPLVSKEKLFGRVTHVNGVFIRSRGQRIVGRWIAALSRGQSTCYLALSKSGLNRFRHFLEKKGLFPRVPIRPIVKMLHPINWSHSLQSFRSDREFNQLRKKLSSKGIAMKPWSSEDVPAMTQVWNGSFASHVTTIDRISKLICGSPWFDPSGCFMVMRNQELLGWALIRPELEIFKAKKQGFIDIFAITSEGWRQQIDSILFEEILRHFRKRDIRQIFLGPHPSIAHASGIHLSPFLIGASKFGFEPYQISAEYKIKVADYERQAPQMRIKIRSCQASDEVFVTNFFEKVQRPDLAFFYERSKRHPGIHALVAEWENSIVGFCCWVLDEEMKDCSDVTWIWAVSQPERRRGYFLHLFVEQRYRRKGVGTALAERAFGSLFDAGCEEIMLDVVQDEMVENFYERFGLRKIGTFLQLRRQEKT